MADDTVRFRGGRVDAETVGHATTRLNEDPTEMPCYNQALFFVSLCAKLGEMPIERLYELVEREGVYLGEKWHGRPAGRVILLSAHRGNDEDVT